VTELPKGYLWEGRYEVVKSLEKGSGGSVYLVNDLSLAKSESTRLVQQFHSHSSITEGIYNGQQLDQEPSENIESFQKVLKIYEGAPQFEFFKRENQSLSNLSKIEGQRFPGIIKMHDA